MKAGDLVKWKTPAHRLLSRSGTGTGIVVSIAWTAGNAWIKWPDLENLLLCNVHALEAV